MTAAATASVSVAHHIPGRVRLRLPRSHRLPVLLSTVRDALLALSGIQRVAIDVRTGSVLVEHDAEQASLERIGTAVASAAGLAFDAGVAMPETAPARIAAPAVPIARGLRGVTASANRIVRGLTGGLFDLRFLVPATLAALAIWQLSRTGAGWQAPPYTLLWYAFSLFMTFNVK